MISKLQNAIAQLSLRMKQLKAAQQENWKFSSLTDRDEMIISLLSQKGPLTVSEIAECEASASFSTISTNISKLWKSKLVSKTICPENQRVTIVELTPKGQQIAQDIKSQTDQRSLLLLQALKLTSAETEMLMSILNRAIPFFDSKLGLKNELINPIGKVNLFKNDSFKSNTP